MRAEYDTKIIRAVHAAFVRCSQSTVPFEILPLNSLKLFGEMAKAAIEANK